jgi:hypothetical protein
MKKFSDISDKDAFIDFDDSKKEVKVLSSDIEKLDNQIKDTINSTILDGEWEIVNIIDVTTSEPEKISEAIIINAELGDKSIKRGDHIYITALIHKKGNQFHQNQMGVIKVRIVDIYNTLLVLNNIR